MLGDHRRYEREKFRSKVTVSWGRQRCVGNCINISNFGALVEIPVPIPVGVAVSIHFQVFDVCWDATVKHCRRYCTWYRVGVHSPNAILRDHTAGTAGTFESRQG